MGYLVLGISVVIVAIIFLFSSVMNEIVNVSCGEEHGVICPMHDSINQQTYLSLLVVGVLVIFGLVLVFSKPEEKIIVKKVKERVAKKKFDLSGFDSAEKKVFEIIRKSRAIFQAELIEKSGVGKVKMTRVLDRLESKGFIERKRRGMTNVVVLKE